MTTGRAETAGSKGSKGSKASNGSARIRTADGPSARAQMRRLVMAGFTALEAGNLTALAIGLRPAASGWTGAQIERLRFLRHLQASGGLSA